MMVISIANILYSHASKPDLEAKFRSIRDNKKPFVDDDAILDGRQAT